MPNPLAKSLNELKLDHGFVDALPADPETGNFRRQVKGACYSFVQPKPAAKPKLAAWSAEMFNELDLDPALAEQDEFARLFCGNSLVDGMQPYSMCYGGHQFGHWAGQLGDGRAIIMGDVINRAGNRWSLQLKGAGPTPYSRQADGFAVLRSSLREFLCSEAMYHLGIPTTRALSLCLTGEKVVRDMFYDGHPQAEPGAVVCRAAPSFLRFGNFQIHAAQRDTQTLKQLTDYCIQQFFPEIGPPGKETYIAWFDRVCSLTAEMVVHWQRVGFVHGVMNTDNMSILGLTIDYGPYGWLEDYDPDWTPNTTDAQGRRYRYGQQPMIAQWNLLQLAEALLPLIEDPRPLEDSLTGYSDSYRQLWSRTVADKLGFSEVSAQTDELYKNLENLLAEIETDMTLFFRALSGLDLNSDKVPTASELRDAFGACWYQEQQVSVDYLHRLSTWLESYHRQLRDSGVSQSGRRTLMDSVNPKYVPRNYLAQLAIDKLEQGDASLLNEWLDVLRHPYDEQPGFEQYAEKRPEWARHRAGCSMLSCSS